MCSCMHACWGAFFQRLEEGIRSPGAGVIAKRKLMWFLGLELESSGRVASLFTAEPSLLLWVFLLEWQAEGAFRWWQYGQ